MGCGASAETETKKDEKKMTEEDKKILRKKFDAAFTAAFPSADVELREERWKELLEEIEEGKVRADTTDGEELTEDAGLATNRADAFNFPYYELSATHNRVDQYFQPQKGSQTLDIKPKLDSQQVCTASFTRGNIFQRFTVRNGADFDNNNYLQEALVTETGSVPKNWANFKDAFADLSSFAAPPKLNHGGGGGVFQVPMPPMVEGAPPVFPGLDADASDHEKMDFLVGVPAGTMQRTFEQWDKVECDMLIVIPGKNKFQPAFAGILFYYVPSADDGALPSMPTFYSIVSATGEGVPAAIFINVVSPEAAIRPIVAPAGAKFSPIANDTNWYTHYITDAFRFEMYVFFEEAPPVFPWDDAETKGGHPYLNVNVVSTGKVDKPADKIRKLVKTITKGGLMLDVTEVYYEDGPCARVIDPIDNADVLERAEGLLLVTVVEFLKPEWNAKPQVSAKADGKFEPLVCPVIMPRRADKTEEKKEEAPTAEEEKKEEAPATEEEKTEEAPAAEEEKKEDAPAAEEEKKEDAPGE